jgi:hypothetical protein
MLSCPVHQVRRVLIRTKEEDLGVFSARSVDDRSLDTGRLTGNEQVDDGLRVSVRTAGLQKVTYVDVSLKRLLEVGIELRKDSTLGTSLWNILVFCISSVDC